MTVHPSQATTRINSQHPVQRCFIGTALRNDLDVHAYMEDVLRRALAGETNWAAMAPHVWKSEHPESIRTYRQEERRQAADRKRVRRARRRLKKKSTGRT